MGYFEHEPNEKEEALRILNEALGQNRATTVEEARKVDTASRTGAGKIISPDGLHYTDGTVI